MHREKLVFDAEVIALARELDFPEVLPAAFYAVVDATLARKKRRRPRQEDR